MCEIKQHTCVLTIAGSDASGGAGIQADIKAISATGAYAASVITALTAQNTQGVQAIHAIPPSFVSQQMESVFCDIKLSAVKIGMLFNKDIIDAVTRVLKRYQPHPIVLDPVMVSQSGSALLEPETIESLKQHLFDLATLITPNISEAEKLTGTKITHSSEMEQVAIALGNQYRTNILVKGGHLNTQEASDVLYSYENARCHWYTSIRVDTHNTHGTGCTLSSAIASYLAQNYALPDAVAAAKHYLTQAIQSGSTLRLGQGHGPVDHFYKLGRCSP